MWSIAFLLWERVESAFKRLLWFSGELDAGYEASEANGWRERRGQAERKRGLPTLCESGRERSEFCEGRKRWHGQARTGTQIHLRGGLAVAVFPHPT